MAVEAPPETLQGKQVVPHVTVHLFNLVILLKVKF